MFQQIKAKFGAIFSLLSVLGFSLVIFGVTRINQVTNHASLVMSERIPLSRSAEEALLALSSGEGIIDRILLIQDPAEMDRIHTLDVQFKETALTFEAFIRAMIWGTESEAFRESSGGKTWSQWKKLGLDGKLIVTNVPYDIKQAAGKASLYFGVFSKYVGLIIASQAEALALQGSGKKDEIAREEIRKMEYIKKAKRYKNLVDGTLQEVVAGIYTHVEKSNDTIQHARNSAITALISFSLVIFGLAFFIGMRFASSISKPLIHLKNAAAEIAGGKLATRVDIASNDEIGSLAETFNKMVEEVQKAYDDLEKKIRERTSELWQANHLLKEEIVERKRIETDLRLMAEEVKKAHNSLEDQVRARTQELESFVYTLSHGLKSPVVSLQGVSSLLLQEYEQRIDEKGKHYIRRILSNTEYMADFIQGMQTLTQIGSREKMMGPVALGKIIDDILKRHRDDFERRKVRVEVDPALPHFVFEGFYLTQLFENLILNAARFMGDQPRPKIEIGGAESKEWVDFYVKDNGIGIDPAYHKKIFDPFEQLKEIEGGGVGIGLSIISKIVTLAGGTIWVESQKGGGAIFFVRLPRQNPPASQQQDWQV